VRTAVIALVSPRLLAALLLLAPACATNAPARSSSADSVAIDSLYAEFRAGYATLDAQRVANLYATDALYGAPDGPAYQRGRGTIVGNFTGFFDAMRRDSATLEVRFRFERRYRTPALASDVGYYWLRAVHGDSGGPPSAGKFTTVIAPDSAGRWRFVLDSYSEAAVTAFDSAPPFEP
jgi:uncharacterized protein (TIGR02246 family)